MKTSWKTLAITLAALFFATSSCAQEISVPDKPRKKDVFKKNAQVNGRDPTGYIGLQAVVLVPLDDTHYAYSYGSIAGKKKGDSFHYFENEDLGFVCKGFGKPTRNGGSITNECFLNGASTGKQTVSVPDYGSLSGKMTFDVFDQGDLVGLAIMQWVLNYANPKKLYKTLKATTR